MNWRELIRNKKLMLGLGGAAGLGLVVLVMRRGRPPGEGDATSEPGGTTTLQPGTYDSTGTDIYNGLQALFAGQDARWGELIERLGDVQSKLPKTPPGTPTTPPKPGPLKPGQRKQPGPTQPIKTRATSGRWSWLNLAEYWYNLAGMTAAQKQAYANKLRDANKNRWFGKPMGPNMPYTSSTVAGGVPVTVPASL